MTFLLPALVFRRGGLYRVKSIWQNNKYLLYLEQLIVIDHVTEEVTWLDTDQPISAPYGVIYFPNRRRVCACFMSLFSFLIIFY